MQRILIVVDMQNDFIDGALGTKEAQEIIKNAADKIKGHNGSIYVTFDTHFENYLETAEGKKLPVIHCVKETTGWNLNFQIENALQGKDVVRVEKLTFGSVDLPKLIAEKFDVNDVQIELIGLCTDICVVSNALLLKAHFPETDIFVDASCCAGVTKESHNAALATMKMCQINVTGEDK